MFDQSETCDFQDPLAGSHDSSLKSAELEAPKSQTPLQDHRHNAARVDRDNEPFTMSSHDVLHLRQEVLQLKGEVGMANGQDRLRDRLAFLEKDICGSVEKLTNAMDEIVLYHAGYRAKLEARVSKLEGAYTEDLKELVQIPQRVALLEQDCRDAARRHREEAIGMHAAIDKQTTDLVLCRDALCKRIDAFEESVMESVPKQTKMLAEFQGSYDSLLRDWEEHKLDSSPLRERLGFLEKQFTELVGKTDMMSLDLWRSVDDLRRAHLQDFASHDQVGYLESELGRFAEKHRRELGECKTCHDKVAKDLVCLESKHASIAERTTVLEMQTELSEKYCRMLRDLQLQHAELRSNSGSIPERAACAQQQLRDSTDKLAQDLQIIQRARDQFESRIVEITGESDGWRASVARRLDALERTLRDKTDQQAKEPAALRPTYQEHTGHVSHSDMEERIASHDWYGSKQDHVLRGELLNHRWAEHPGTSMEERIEACEKFLRPELFSSQDRAHMIANGLLGEVDSKVALVTELTRSASSSSLPARSLNTSPGRHSSPLSLAKGRWGSNLLRRCELARSPLDVGK